MKTLMRNGRDRRSENPFLGHAKKERVSLFGTDQRITSGPAARRPHSKAEYMTAPERFADSQIPLAPRAPSIHDPACVKTHTIAKCRKYNSPTRYRTSCAQHDSTPCCAISSRCFYVRGGRWSFRTAKTHNRHARLSLSASQTELL